MAEVSLSERKQLLVARATLQRLRLRQESRELRRLLVAPRNVLAIAASPPVRSLAIGALMLALGRGRAAGLVRGAMTALAIVKGLRVAIGLFGARGTAAHSAEHTEWLIDEGSKGSFPASDPSSITQPHPHG